MIARLAALGFGKTDILHVADSLFRDHAPAARCGLASAWIDRGQNQTASEYCRFTSIVDLVKSHQEQLVL
jgi:FMN phosphatase YigB (HAD superfamily)